jgi:hypothetical protein
MPILLADLIAQLPADTEDKVQTARDRFRQRIRDILGEETRLYLQRKSRSRRGRTSPINVQISVNTGLPGPLEGSDQQTIEDRHRVSIILAPFRQALAEIAESGERVSAGLLPMLANDPVAAALLRGEERHLMPAVRYAGFLLEQLKQFELTKFILRIDRDVMGIYYDGNDSLFGEPDPRIDLYWGVIGLIARDLAVDVLDLTYVVLSHELAHAFTHAAVDADGEWWKTANFWKSSHELAEGLAQFYTEIVCSRIEETAPGALKAYKALLPYQPPAYRTHKRWERYTPEHVRSAMLQIRRSADPSELNQFENCLKNEKRRLSRNNEAAGAGA